MAHISRIRKKITSNEEVDSIVARNLKTIFDARVKNSHKNHAAINWKASQLAGKETPIGVLVGEMSLFDYLCIQNQYGDAAFADDDFMKFFRKDADQTFLDRHVPSLN